MMQTWQDSTTSTSYSRNKIWGATGSLTVERIDRMNYAQNSLNQSVWSQHPEVAAQAYFDEFMGNEDASKNVEPYPLRYSEIDQQQEAWRKFNRDTQPAKRLLDNIDNLYLYSLHAKDLGLDEYYEDAYNFPLRSYDPTLRAVWEAKVKEHFGENYFLKIEHSTRMHVHLLADKDAGLLHIPRGGEVIKPVKAGDEIKVLGYLYKPHATCTVENLAIWIHAKRKLGLQGKNLPKKCRYVIPRQNPSVLSIINTKTTTNKNSSIESSTGNNRRKYEDNGYQLPEIIDISKIDRTKYRDYG